MGPGVLYTEVSTGEGRGWEEKEGHLMTPSEAINHTRLNFFPCYLPQIQLSLVQRLKSCHLVFIFEKERNHLGGS